MTVIDSFAGRYWFLSNFAPWWITYEGIDYPSNEHAFQAAKTTDRHLRIKIAIVQTPTEAKRVGRSVHLREGWDSHLRYTVMEELIGLKFNRSQILAKRLAETGNAVLIEGNAWHDQVWGDCRCGRGSCAKTGMNLLGWMLMRQRAMLTTFLPRLEEVSS